MRILLAALAVLGFTGGSSHAQTLDCDQAQTQAAMNTCAEQALQAADADLNQSYAALMNQITPEGQAALRSAQRAWIAYRDAQCSFESAGSAGGSAHAMVVSSCLDALTRAQTARLSAQLNCQEGDLSCGGQ